jgi:hypothetical protein
MEMLGVYLERISPVGAVVSGESGVGSGSCSGCAEPLLRAVLCKMHDCSVGVYDMNPDLLRARGTNRQSWKSIRLLPYAKLDDSFEVPPQ